LKAVMMAIQLVATLDDRSVESLVAVVVEKTDEWKAGLRVGR
jgi:hypothetical protein